MKSETVRLPYQTPFDFSALTWIYRAHLVGDLEWFEGERFHRIFEYENRVGQLAIADDPNQSEVVLRIESDDPAARRFARSRAREIFDLDADPQLIARALSVDPKLRRLVRKHPGVRMFSGWDPFEIAISTILGQLVSLERARALVCRLIAQHGRETDLVREGRPVKLFPTPETLAKANFDDLGTTRIRRRTLTEFSAAVVEGRISLDREQDPERFIQEVSLLHGIGPWSANYMALRVLRHTDAFPATDLILARALELHPHEVIERTRPWRGYAAALLWREYADSLKRKGKEKNGKPNARNAARPVSPRRHRARN